MRVMVKTYGQKEPPMPISDNGITDRRKHPRTYLNMGIQAIRLDPDGGDVVQKLSMTDISRSGMGVVSDRPMYPGQRLLVTLPLSEGSGRRNLYARLVHCRERKGAYRLGVEFDRVSVGSWSDRTEARSTAA